MPSNDFYRTLFENCPSACIISRHDKVIYVNQACLAMFGYRKMADVVGTSLFSHIAPDHREKIIKRVSRRLAGENEPDKYTTWGLKSDGTVFPFEVNVTLLELPDGLATVAYITDITRHLQVEQVLKESEAKWRLIAENSPDHIMILDCDFQVQFVNYSMEGLVGKQDMGKPLVELLPDISRDVMFTCLRNALKAQEPDEFEFVSRSKLGDPIYFESRVCAIQDASQTNLLVSSRNVTENRLAKQELEKSEKKYRELVNEASSAILRWNKKGEVTFFNEYAQSFFGYEEKEILGKNIVGTIVPETESSGRDLGQLMVDICNDPLKYEYSENENITRSGKRVWVAWRNKPVFNDQGELVEILSVGLDCTERKKVEEKIESSEKELKAILNSLQDTYYRADNEGRINRTSPSAEKLLGYSLDELNKLRIEDLYLRPEERENFLKALADNDGVMEDYQVQLRRKDGSAIWVSANVHFIWNEQGEPAGVEGIARDISSYKKLEAALMQSTARFQAIFNTLSDAVVFANQQREIVMVNPAVSQLFGYTQDELVSRSTEIIYASREDFLQQGNRRFNAHAVAKETLYEVVYRRKDGSTFVGETFGSKVQNDKGELLGFIGIIRDITDKKQMDERLRLSQKIFEDTAKAILVMDFNRQIIDMNDALCNVTGFSREDITGKGLEYLLSEKHGNLFAGKLWKGLDIEGFWEGEFWARKKSGEPYPNWATISVVKDEKGSPRHYVAVFSDISEIKATEERLEQMAHYDQLTGLPNRMLFHERLGSTIIRAKRHQDRIAVMYADLDGFKQVNDSLGHSAGDELLISIGERLKNCVRDEDLVARLGGDEFAIIINELQDNAYLQNLARRIVSELSCSLQFEGRELRVSGSLGIAVYPADGESGEALLRHADQAMYFAKQRGKNNYQFYNPALNARIINRIRQESDLRQAISQDALQVKYQPKFDVLKNEVTGLEALVRWIHPERGELLPREFIPLAEESDLIVALGNCVLRKICSHIKTWYASGQRAIPVAINISARQFRHNRFLQGIQGLLKAAGIAPMMLEIELTESALMEDIEHTIRILNDFKQLGLKVFIDDFGTGYSSLNYLKKLPVDALKIDKSFVMDIVNSEDDRAIISAIVSLAKNLNLHVIAEGVEDVGQVKFLSQLSCHEIQGYLLTEPVEFDELEGLVREIEGQGLCCVD